MMERWQELISYLNMTAEWAQVLIGAAALGFGAFEIRRHREKVKLERNSQLSEKIIQNLYNIENSLQEIFNSNISTKFLINDEENSIKYDIPKEFVNLYLKLEHLNNSILLKEREIFQMFSQLSVWADFLKDKKTSSYIESLRTQIIFLNLRIRESKDCVDSESEQELQKLSKEERHKYVSQKKKEFRIFWPGSYWDENFEELKIFRKKLEQFKAYVLENHVF